MFNIAGQFILSDKGVGDCESRLNPNLLDRGAGDVESRRNPKLSDRGVEDAESRFMPSASEKGAGDRAVSAPDSKVTVLALATNEELIVARRAYRVLTR